MYVGTIVEWDDQTTLNKLPITTVRRQPLFAAVFSSDKGIEDWVTMSGEEFFNMYGNISFDKHGQPLLQTAIAINAGAKVFCKRLVASDATLANVAIIATVTKSDVPVQATDAAGNLLYYAADGTQTTEVTDSPVYLYIDASGNDTTEVTDTQKTTSRATIKYEAKTVENCVDHASAIKAITDGLTEGQYLLYVIADNGRGASRKRFKIVPNYTLSKSVNYVMYNFVTIEAGIDIERINFNPIPSLVSGESNISLSSRIRDKSTQLVCYQDDTAITNFLTAVSNAAGLDIEQAMTYDLLFGYDKKGAKLQNVVIDSTGADLQNSYGLALKSGTNGAFGDKPIDTQEYVTQAVEALNGTFDTTIYNVDQHKIDAFIDGNYPSGIKRAIESLVSFREDFVYFRDLGVDLNNIELIEAADKESLKSKFCCSYCPVYDVIDPYTRKQITVTMGYSLSKLLVNHFNNGRNLPIAGIKYNMIIDDIVPGTLQFCPVVCPDPVGNQKERLEDARINYASYIDNRLVIETLYTSQENATQLSYVNNILAVQEVIKAIRTRCPAIRYTFIDGEDFEMYKRDIETVIDPYRSNFKSLEIVYTEDESFAANKIFYATLKVVFKDFVQTEWFKVTALNASDAVNSNS